MTPFKLKSGAELLALFECGYGQFIHSRGVAFEGPLVANETIRKHFGLKPYFLHSQVPFFQKLAIDCEALCSARSVINRIMLLAPHNHWKIDAPIIYTFELDNERIIVGNRELNQEAGYLPVSFVLIDGAIYPYEWIDRSFGYDYEFFAENYGVIEDLFEKHFKSSPPLGLGVDFRGNFVGRGPNEGSVELPVEGEPGYKDFSQIIGDEKFLSLGNDFENIVRVAWPLETDESLSLDSVQQAVLNEIRYSLERIDDLDGRTQFIRSIEERLLK